MSESIVVMGEMKMMLVSIVDSFFEQLKLIGSQCDSTTGGRLESAVMLMDTISVDT